MSCEINDRIKDNILDKIADMSLADKKLYLINYITKIMTEYNEDELHEALAEVMWEEQSEGGI